MTHARRFTPAAYAAPTTPAKIIKSKFAVSMPTSIAGTEKPQKTAIGNLIHRDCSFRFGSINDIG